MSRKKQAAPGPLVLSASDLEAGFERGRKAQITKLEFMLAHPPYGASEEILKALKKRLDDVKSRTPYISNI